MTYLTVSRPSSATSKGLVTSLENGLCCLGIPSLDATCRKLVGMGTDGASANIAA